MNRGLYKGGGGKYLDLIELDWFWAQIKKQSMRLLGGGLLLDSSSKHPSSILPVITGSDRVGNILHARAANPLCLGVLAVCIGDILEFFQVPTFNLLADAPNSPSVGKSQNVIIILGCVLTFHRNVQK